MGVADTGIDFDSCYFRDDSRAVPINTVDSSHRKIVRYTTFSSTDALDVANGHGTHVAGGMAIV